MKPEHVALNVPDPKAAARWYADHLGLRIIKANDRAPFAHFLSDGAGGMLEFYNNPNGDIPSYSSLSPYTLHLAFTVSDLESNREKLVAAGATEEGAVEVTPVGDKLLFLRDLWGCRFSWWCVLKHLSKANRTTGTLTSARN